MKSVKAFFNYSEYLSILKTLLVPNKIYDALERIPLEPLLEKGYTTILLDVDNTILAYNQKVISIQKINWIELQKKLGFRIFLVSNNRRKARLLKISEQIDVPGIYMAFKPYTKATLSLLEKYYISTHQTIVIGDQILTDILMGNWISAYTILVDPVDKKLSFIKTLQRELELYLLKKFS